MKIDRRFEARARPSELCKAMSTGDKDNVGVVINACMNVGRVNKVPKNNAKDTMKRAQL